MAWEIKTVSDEELARLTQVGSLSAFEKLVYRYEGRIHRFVANLCRNDADAREITQDTFVRAFQAIAQFDLSKKFAPWLFTIARRKSIDHHRATPPMADEPVPDQTDHDDPASQLARKEARQGLWSTARQHLPPLQFEALWLKYAEEMSVEEIAQVLRKTRTHVKVLLFRARTTLGHEIEIAGKAPNQPNGVATAGSKPKETPGLQTGPAAARLKQSGLGLV
ncbi:RNA polymerase sigma factor [Pedosphaera parvula]|uniref:RNA polymerase, sigma-24 subunit, ECF subfamily n=1 Tax=Pedosphaera parvula (strain Ellin514) TaxID=320771 RepID=B9XNH1_PEDPL|nr:sigma-70 family RNA polymerase sigma factor [Pedosphaera parvula]EEF58630.1 RNA polymerase, sigma-24 subunit, ECF subfamily [Pedosphaera parvula Ellin514]